MKEKDPYEVAIMCHNELIRRSNEEFSQESKQAWRASERSTRASIKLTRVSIALSFFAVIFAGVAIWYNQSDMTSDEVWQNSQLELLKQIRDNIQNTKILQRENDSLKNELFKAEMLLRAYEE